MAGSLRCSPEAITTLLISYNPIQIKKLKYNECLLLQPGLQGQRAQATGQLVHEL